MAHLDVCEHNHDWIAVYEPQLVKAANISIRHFELEYFEYNGQTNDKYAGLIEFVDNQKYDFIIVDGPVGGGKNFPRSNILDLIRNNNLSQNFAIIFDDASRPGEKETISHVEEMLSQHHINYSTFKRNGIKHQYVITSESWSYAKYL